MSTEAELEQAVRRARNRLVERTNDFTSVLRVTLDPMKPVRRNPIGGIVASMATGLLLGATPAPRRAERPAATNGEPASGGRVGKLLWSSLALVAPILQEAATRWITGRPGRGKR
jgi:hypothetical protein